MPTRLSQSPPWPPPITGFRELQSRARSTRGRLPDGRSRQSVGRNGSFRNPPTTGDRKRLFEALMLVGSRIIPSIRSLCQGNSKDPVERKPELISFVAV